MNTIQTSIRIILPTELDTDATVDMHEMRNTIAQQFPEATVVLDGVEVAGPSTGSGFSNNYTS